MHLVQIQRAIIYNCQTPWGGLASGVRSLEAAGRPAGPLPLDAATDRRVAHKAEPTGSTDATPLELGHGNSASWMLGP